MEIWSARGTESSHLAIQAASISPINHKALIYYGTQPAGMVMTRLCRFNCCNSEETAGILFDTLLGTLTEKALTGTNHAEI